MTPLMRSVVEALLAMTAEERASLALALIELSMVVIETATADERDMRPVAEWYEELARRLQEVADGRITSVEWTRRRGGGSS